MRKAATGIVITAPETSNVIPISIVPFGPAPRKLSQLISTGAGVPGFRDEFGILQLCVTLCVPRMLLCVPQANSKQPFSRVDGSTATHTVI